MLIRRRKQRHDATPYDLRPSSSSAIKKKKMSGIGGNGTRNQPGMRFSEKKTLRAEPLPSQQGSSITCSFIQNQTVSSQKVGSYVDVEFESHKHALFVRNNFIPSDFELKFAPSNLSDLPMIKPGVVYRRPGRRDHTHDSVEDSVSLPWNNPFPTKWGVPDNQIGEFSRVQPIHPENIHREPVNPAPPFEDILWPALS
ncbi:uncharacterized protein LOC124651576 isoform X2 [Lolium rigidum]|uniref:uncharacterized protein LOC124651576 isoform X2 n=1 Tax=Lolium rigidum TaxID=89674 RepID=UPI001F5C308A|nr:uncharacterized protein LOC124651576 isoform X2 [Lolium rigidum]